MQPPVFNATERAWLALDIETGDGSPEAAYREFLQWFEPDARWKAETVGTRFLEARAARDEKLALCDSAPILCVALRTESELACLHAMYAHPPRIVGGAMVQGFATLREMLEELRSGFDARVGDDTVIVGHNILGFDLRKLRNAYLREKARMPAALARKDQPVFDTMDQYGRRFSIGKAARSEMFTTLDFLCTEWGLPSPKADGMTGAQVPVAHKAGRFDEIVAYCLRDVVAESNLFLRMTGQVVDDAVVAPVPVIAAAPAAVGPAVPAITAPAVPLASLFVAGPVAITQRRCTCGRDYVNDDEHAPRCGESAAPSVPAETSSRTAPAVAVATPVAAVASAPVKPAFTF